MAFRENFMAARRVLVSRARNKFYRSKLVENSDALKRYMIDRDLDIILYVYYFIVASLIRTHTQRVSYTSALILKFCL